MTIAYIDRITKRYAELGYQPYSWYRAEAPPPWHPLAKTLGETRIGMLSTAGAYLPGQVAYYYKDDTSIRAIPKDTAPDGIHFSHLTENYLVDPRRDTNCIFPITALERLESEGVVGEVAEELHSCMGGIYSQRRVQDELAPRLLEAFRGQGVEAALLVPM